MGHYDDCYESERERLEIARKKKYIEGLAEIRKRLDDGELAEILLELKNATRYSNLFVGR